MAKKNVLVAVDGDVNEIADRLRLAGMQVDEVLGELGIVIGSIDRNLEADLRALKGVLAINPNSTIGLPGET